MLPKERIKGGNTLMASLQIRNREGELLAESCFREEGMLCFDHAWEEGDRIELDAGEPSHWLWRLDSVWDASEVYLPTGRLHWTVPGGEHRTAYAPGAFDNVRHIITLRKMTDAEIQSERDLARNPSDLRGDISFFPHCTANVETRNESVFAARNVIDGLRFNTSHGEWPFESWGIGAREDAWCRIDFGREVTVRRMALTLRADFPHDAYWVSGHARTSDGAEFAFELQKTAERQWVDLGIRTVRWIQLERLQKSDDPSAFPSLRAWEVIGKG